MEWVAVKGLHESMMCPNRVLNWMGFLRRDDLIAVAPPDEGGEACVAPRRGH